MIRSIDKQLGKTFEECVYLKIENDLIEQFSPLQDITLIEDSKDEFFFAALGNMQYSSYSKYFLSIILGK